MVPLAGLFDFKKARKEQKYSTSSNGYLSIKMLKRKTLKSVDLSLNFK